jgi:2-haloacid dehalogenase
MLQRTIVVFDLGGVLIDWDPRHLYRKLINDEAAMEHFLAEVCSPAWNLEQDRGRPWKDAIELLVRLHPIHANLIAAFHERWPEMLGGPIPGSVGILRELRARATPLYALTNWSDETFHHAENIYDFLGWFHGIVVSGREKIVKPDPAIYRLLCRRFALDPATLVYIDDNPNNVAAASELGMHGIHFTAPPALRGELASLGLLSCYGEERSDEAISPGHAHQPPG